MQFVRSEGLLILGRVRDLLTDDQLRDRSWTITLDPGWVASSETDGKMVRSA